MNLGNFTRSTVQKVGQVTQKLGKSGTVDLARGIYKFVTGSHQELVKPLNTEVAQKAIEAVHEILLAVVLSAVTA